MIDTMTKHSALTTHTTVTGAPDIPLAATDPAARRPVAHGSDRSALLRGALRTNAALSIGSGVTMAVAGGRVAELLGVASPGWVRLVGLAVVLFGLDVAIVSSRPTRQLRSLAPWVVAADALWVAASAATIAAGWYSGIGTAVVIAMAIAVGSVGTAQFVGWRRIS